MNHNAIAINILLINIQNTFNLFIFVWRIFFRFHLKKVLNTLLFNIKYFLKIGNAVSS